MVTVSFVTNRNPLGDEHPWFGKLLGPVSGTAIRFGTAEVDLEKGKEGTIISVTIEKERLASKRPGSKNLKFGSDAIFEFLRGKMDKHKRDTLLYIHGFANPFDQTILRAAQIKKFLGANLNVVVFSWPSDGEVLLYSPYFRDRSDAQSSGVAIARGILIFARYLHELRRKEREASDESPVVLCDQCIHLLVHSMGNWALRHGVLELKKGLAGNNVKLFDKVFLVGADEDNDTLDRPDKMAFLPAIANEICVYHTSRDRALIVAEETKGNEERLGSDGPPNARNLPDKVSIIDVTDVLYADNDLTNHQYYRVNRLVREDIVAVLNGESPMEIPGRKYNAHSRRFKLLHENDR